MSKRCLTVRDRIDTAEQWLMCDRCEVGERLCISNNEPCDGLKPKLFLPPWFLLAAIIVSIAASFIMAINP